MRFLTAYINLVYKILCLTHILAQLHVPIRHVEEMLPTFVVLVEADVDLHEGTPFGAFGFVN